MRNTITDIGVDLGTTFSVIAVKGRVNLVDGYPPSIYLAECDVSIIPTPEGDSTFPSVFWVDPNDPSRVLIGIEAKQKADEGEAPIMFSKRSIGTNESLKIHDRMFTAKEVAIYILKYLKGCAERALGQPVYRAVVTHPAYFDPNQVQETREAAIAAGFEMGLPEQMMMEPSAAALAYTAGVEKDPLRAGTYDLGGGTFDVAVLERSQGVITIKAFDGDHLLGGYNFDRELVQWTLNRLKEKGRQIPYDDQNPEDRGRRARLLQLAESVKMKLSEQRNAKVFVDIKAPDILVDVEGKKVQIHERINREQYADLIKEHLDKTIDCCHSALAKAGMEAKDLDVLLLVGGSTYGQWVIEAVQKAFGKEVQVYNPDLCVAAGAAIRAATLPAVARVAGLELLLDVPATSALPRIHVAGALRLAKDAMPIESDLKDFRVLLYIPNGAVKEMDSLLEEGRFLFEEIDLEEGPNELRLEITDGKGLPRLDKSFSVQYAPEGSQIVEVHTVLPKPIYLRTADGMKLIAEEGATLPSKCEIQLIRLHDDSAVDIEVFQEQEMISIITVKDIPDDAGRSSKVMLSVEITQHNKMKGTVSVLARTGQVVRKEKIDITFPPLRLPDLPELHARFDELEGRRQQLEALSNDPEERTLLAGKGKKISRKIEKCFGEQAPDRQEIYTALKDLNALVNPPSEDMNPPRSQFRRILEDCQNMLAANGSDPQLQPLQTMLRRVETDGNDAYTTKNHKKWAAANENLVILHNKIKNLIEGGDPGSGDLPETPILKDQAKQEVGQLRGNLRAKREALENDPKYPTKFKPRLDKLEKAIDQMDAAIDKVEDSLEPKRGLAQLQVAIRPKGQIQKDIDNVDKDTGKA